MPSDARNALTVRLEDVDELIKARDAICPEGAGRPAQRQGAAVLRGGLLLLAAAFEAFAEDLFDLGVDRLYGSLTDDERKYLKKQTSGKLNNADVFKLNMLFLNLGVPLIMQGDTMRWQKCSNEQVRKRLNKLVDTRNAIAHGKSRTVRKKTLVNARTFVTLLADRMDRAVADGVQARIGGAHPW